MLGGVLVHAESLGQAEHAHSVLLISLVCCNSMLGMLGGMLDKLGMRGVLCGMLPSNG
jgi:hypothetical protein